MKSIYRGSFVSRQCALALLLGAFVVLFLSQSPARAQAGAGTGRIEGTVTDSSGAVVPGAQVTAREESTNITASVKTDLTALRCSMWRFASERRPPCDPS